MRCLALLLVLAGCDALPELPSIDPELREGLEPYASCAEFCADPAQDNDSDAEVGVCEQECAIAEVDCPEELQEIWDCWYAARANARDADGDRVDETDCNGLQWDLEAACGVDLSGGGSGS